MEKDFFDLNAHDEILGHLNGLKRKQAVVAGSETDVCVLQSCLGLMESGYQVFLVEDLVFSSSPDVGAAVRRLRDRGVTVLTYKTLFHELLRAHQDSRQRKELICELGPFPEIPDQLD